MSKQISTPLNGQVIFSFFRIENAETYDETGNLIIGDGYVCVALQRPKNRLPKKGSKLRRYKAAASFCSPVENLNRKRGRQIAVGRLVCERGGRSYSFATSPKMNWKNVFKQALKLASDPKRKLMKKGQKRTYAPDWLINAVKVGKTIENLSR